MIPETPVLETHRLRLEPLSPAHLDELVAVGNNDELWAKVASGNPFGTTDGARAWFAAADAPDRLAFVMVDRASGAVVGSTQLYDIDLPNRKLEVGKTFVSPAYWRTYVNTHSKFLVFRYAFEEMNVQRIQLRVGAPNERSRRAIERLGATYEATMRSFFVHALTAEPRDVIYYSIIASEWPATKARLEALLSTAAS